MALIKATWGWDLCCKFLNACLRLCKRNSLIRFNSNLRGQRAQRNSYALCFALVLVSCTNILLINATFAHGSPAQSFLRLPERQSLLAYYPFIPNLDGEDSFTTPNAGPHDTDASLGAPTSAFDLDAVLISNGEIGSPVVHAEGGVVLDGNSYLRIPVHLGLDASQGSRSYAFTIGGWVKLSSLPSGDTISVLSSSTGHCIKDGMGIGIHVHSSDNQLVWAVSTLLQDEKPMGSLSENEGYVVSNETPILSKWTFIAAVFNKTDDDKHEIVTFYIDMKQVTLEIPINLEKFVPMQQLNPKDIDYFCAGVHLDGLMDSIFIYKSPLMYNDIFDIYQRDKEEYQRILPFVPSSSGYAVDFDSDENGDHSGYILVEDFNDDENFIRSAEALYEGTIAVSMKPNLNSLTNVRLRNEMTLVSIGDNSLRLYIYSEPGINDTSVTEATTRIGFDFSGQKWNSKKLDLKNNEWVHICITWFPVDESNFIQVKLYVDSSLESVSGESYRETNLNGERAVKILNEQFLLGASCTYFDENHSCNFYQGELDEFQLWNRPLSSESISNIFRHSNTGMETGLISYYTFDEWLGISRVASNNYPGGHGIVRAAKPQGKRPLQTVSECKIDDYIMIPEDRALYLFLNITTPYMYDPNLKPSMKLLLLSLPTNGKLYLSTPTRVTQGDQIQSVPFIFEYGESFVFVPFRGLTSTQRTSFLTYKLDDKNNELIGNVTIILDEMDRQAIFETSNKETTVKIYGYRAYDVDAWEGIDDLDMALEIQSMYSHSNTLANYDTYLTLASRNGLYIGFDDGASNGKRDVKRVRFSGGTENINAAINPITLEKPIEASNSIDTLKILLSDEGNNGKGGKLYTEDEIQIGVNLAVVPLMRTVSPGEVLSLGNSSVTIHGFNFIGECFCLFLTKDTHIEFKVKAEVLSRYQLNCIFAGQNKTHTFSKTVLLRIQNGANRFSNTVTIKVRDTPSLESISPMSSSVSGNTKVILSMIDAVFEPEDSLSCVFGQFIVPASFLSMKSISCVTPVVKSVLSVKLGIRRNGRIHFLGETGANQFHFLQQTSVTNIVPAKGPIQGDTTLKIYGLHFFNTTELVCLFSPEGAPVSAIYISSVEVECTSPPATSKSFSAMRVFVSNNFGRDIGKSTGLFSYIDVPQLYSVSPEGGPISGGTTIHITLDRAFNYNHTWSFQCRFQFLDESLFTEAVFQGPYIIQCTTPLIKKPIWSSISIISTGLDSFEYPMGNLSFQFKPSVTLEQIRPQIVTVDGGKVLTLLGSNFPQDQKIYCLFSHIGEENNSQAIDAHWLSPSTAQCTSPPSIDNKAHLAVVCMSVDGISDLYGCCKPFSYLKMPKVLSISPDKGSLNGGENITFETGSEIEILGQSVYCKFGNTTVKGKVIEKQNGIISCISPIHFKPGTVSVSLSVDGGNSFNGKAKFEYIDSPRLVGVNPEILFREHTYVLVINGVGFFDADIQCSFSDVDDRLLAIGNTNGTYINGTHISCPAPLFEADIRMAIIKVSFNGLDTTFRQILKIFSEIELQNVTPDHGPPCGGTKVVVKGNGFSSDQNLKCIFNHTMYQDAVILSSQRVSCIIPGMSRPGKRVSLGLSVGSQLTGVEVAIELWDNCPKINTLDPAILTRGGSAPIFIKLSNSEADMERLKPKDLACVFSNLEKTPVDSIQSGNVICKPPANLRQLNHNDSIGLYWSLGDQNLFKGQEKHYINYKPSVIITQARPMMSILGSEENEYVHVDGQYIFNSSHLSCHFENNGIYSLFTMAEYVSSNRIRCYLPKFGTNYTSLESHVANLRVTLNKFEFSSPLLFTFARKSKNISIMPTNGPRAGGTKVTVLLPDALVSSSLECEFDETSVKASLSDSRLQVECVTPSVDFAHLDKLKVVSAGVVLTESVDFLFTERNKIVDIFPTKGPAFGNTPVRLTFQDKLENTSQQMCRFGYVLVTASYEDSYHALCQSPPGHLVGDNEALVSFSINNGVNFDEPSSFSFTYTDTSQVFSLSPHFGPVDGGTQIQLHGSNFQHENSVCVFEDKRNRVLKKHSVVYISPEMVLCSSPQHVEGTVSLFLGELNGSGISSNMVAFEYVKPVELESVTPMSGPEDGGTTLYLSGLNIRPEFSIFCNFEGTSHKSFARVSANWYAPGVMTCVTPSGSPGDVKLSISLDGMVSDSTRTNGSHIYFRYSVRAAVTNIHPLNGSIYGGNLAVVRGTGFFAYENDTIYCQFGNEVAVATVIDDSEIKCLVPPAENVTVSTVEVNLKTNHYQIVSSSGVFYSYNTVPRITGIFPTNGPIKGGSVISILGTSFLRSYRCLFGKSLAVAQRVSTSLLQCTSPVTNGTGSVLLQIIEADSDSLGLFDELSPHQFYGSRFEYIEEIEISDVYPKNVPEDGNTMVTVTGMGFVNDDNLLCKFGTSVSVSAVWISSSVIRCNVPRNPKLGVLSIRVTNNLLDFSNYLELEILAKTHITGIYPNIGPSFGNTNVTILGTGFVSTDDLICRFGHISRRARYINDTSIWCTSPGLVVKNLESNGEYMITVESSNNGGYDYSEYSSFFTYTSPTIVTSMFPQSGPIEGKTIVKLKGKAFRKDSTFCSFSSGMLIKATVYSPFEIACIAPEGVEGNVLVRVSSNNGYDFSNTGLFYTYHKNTEAILIYPTSGPENGNTEIVVVGNNFPSGCQMSCKFGTTSGDKIVKAYWRNKGSIACLSPTHEPGVANLTISANGEEFPSTAKPLIFTYLPRMSVNKVAPLSVVRTKTTQVIFEGSGFTEDGMYCLFGNEKLIFAKYLSPTTAECHTPGFDKIGEISLQIGNRDAISETFIFTISNEHALITASPMFGPVDGGTRIYFHDLKEEILADQTMCQFRIKSESSDVSTQNSLYSQLRQETPGDFYCISPNLNHAKANIVGDLSLKLQRENMEETLVVSGLYSFHPPLRLIEATPVRSLEHGGQTIQLRGEGFINVKTLSCKFGNVIVSATWVDEETITCISPAHRIGYTTLSVSNAGEFSSEEANKYVQFEYLPTLRIAKLLPDHGPQYGGTMISMTVSGIESRRSSEQLNCVFKSNSFLGKRITIANTTIKNTNQVECITPPYSSGNVNLTIAYADMLKENGAKLESYTYFTWSNFTYTSQVFLTKIYPTKGPINGGTTITLSGTGFAQRMSSKFECQFVSAKKESLSEKSTCFPKSTKEITCQAPRWSHSREDISVYVGLLIDGVHENINVRYHYYKDVFINNTNPESGPEAGGTTITIIGENFSLQNFWKCRFSNVVVAATVINEQTLQCVSPPMPPGKVPIQITQNDVDFMHVLHSFTYYGTVTISRAYPLSGPAGGGTIIDVQGTNFRKGVLCKVGGSFATETIFVSSEFIKCVSPISAVPEEKENTFIQVGNDGINFQLYPKPYTYLPLFQVLDVSPRLAFIGESTHIYITLAANFTNVAPIFCDFQEYGITPAVLRDHAMILCETPLTDSIPRVVLLDLISSENDSMTRNNGFPFEFQYPLSIKSIHPAFGDENGGTDVSMKVENIPFSKRLHCRFGEVSVEATITSKNSLKCTTPTHKPGVEMVTVSVAGLGFTSTNVYFHFLPSLSINTVEPMSGPLDGGTVIRFRFNEINTRSEHFDPLCLFGNAIVTPAIFLDNEMLCSTPPNKMTENVTLSISFDGVSFLNENLTFSYVDIARVTKVDPSYGPSLGGTAITVCGESFPDPPLSCMFSTQVNEIEAEFLNRSCVTCISPLVDLDINQNTKTVMLHVVERGSKSNIMGASIFPSPIGASTFTFLKPIVVNSIYPTWSVENGGSEVILSGSGFFPSGNLRCKFGAAVFVEAVYRSPTTILCISPPHATGFVSLSFTPNNVDFYGKFDFQYYSKETVTGISPAWGPIYGRTIIKVTGTSFIASQHMGCGFVRLDGVFLGQTPAYFINNTLATCTTPPIEVKGKNSKVKVLISNNGVDFDQTTNYPNAQEGGIFTYHVELTMQKVLPTLLSAGSLATFTIQGGSFHSVKEIFCRLSSKETPDTVLPGLDLTVLSDNRLYCKVAIPESVTGFWQIEVSSNQLDWTLMETPVRVTPMISVSSIYPLRGPEEGFTSVFIDGGPFIASDGLSCRMGNQTVRAKWINNFHISCQSIPSFPGDTCEIMISNDGFNYLNTGYRYTYYVKPSAISINPRSGSTFGNTLLEIRGKNFDVESQYSCFITDEKNSANLTINAEVVSPFLMKCKTTPFIPTVAKVRLIADGANFVEGTLTFTYIRPPKIISVLPKNGPVTGGTEVSLIVSKAGFNPDHDLFCKFGYGMTSPAEIKSRYLAKCIAPMSQNGAGVIPLMIMEESSNSTAVFTYTYQTGAYISKVIPEMIPLGLLDEHDVFVTGNNFIFSHNLRCSWQMSQTQKPLFSKARFISLREAACKIPDFKDLVPGRAKLGIANDGMTLTSGGTSWVTFIPPMHINSISPLSGPVSGGTRLTIETHNLVNGSLECSFTSSNLNKTVFVTALFIESNKVECITPFISPSSRLVQVSLLLNGMRIASSNSLFSFHNSSMVFNLNPFSGPINGGTQLVISGTNFNRLQGPITCHFDFMYAVAAKVENDTTVICTTPVVPNSGRMLFQMKDISGFVDNHGLVFAFKPEVGITKISPSVIPETGGIDIAVHGYGFDKSASEELSCRFGLINVITHHKKTKNSIVKAKWISKTVMICKSPAMRPGIISIEVSSNGIDYSSSGLVVTYTKQISASELAPQFGPNGGGTNIVISGTGFSDTLKLTCKFSHSSGNGFMEAFFIDENHISCVSPNMMHVGDFSSIYVDVLANNIEVPVFHRSSRLSFSVHPSVTIDSIRPALGPENGGTLVRGFGINILSPRNVGARCRVAGIEFAANVHSDTQFSCLIPKLSKDLLAKDTYTFEYSSNEVDFVNAGSFSFYQEPAVKDASPRIFFEDSMDWITIKGSHFLNSGSATCFFGKDKAMAVEYVSESIIRCRAPQHKPGFVLLAYSNNGIDFSENATYMLEFISSLTLFSVSPQVVPSSGNTIITIGSNGFPKVNISTLKCQFTFLDGDRRYSPVLETIDEFNLSCTTPSSQGSKFVWLHLVLYSSENVIKESRNGLFIEYSTIAKVKSIAPSIGSFNGGTVVSIFGEGFVNSNLLKCKFGDITVSAYFISEDVIKCLSPLASTKPSPSNTVAVTVSNDEVSYSPSWAGFTYIQPLQVQRLGDYIVSGKEHMLYVHGANFFNSSDLSCNIGNHGFKDGVYIELVNDTTVICTWDSTDILPSPGAYFVSVSNNGLDYDVSESSLNITETRKVFSVYPSSGPLRGGTLVTIYVEDLKGNTSNSEFVCVFGEFESIARLIRVSELPNQLAYGQKYPEISHYDAYHYQCYSPTHRSSLYEDERVKLSLKIFSGDQSKSMIEKISLGEFFYRIEAKLTGATSRIVSISGNTMLYIAHENIRDTTQLVFRFRYASDHNGTSTLDIFVRNDDDNLKNINFLSESEISIVAPAYPPDISMGESSTMGTPCVLQVSQNNGVDFAPDGIKLFYRDTLAVSSLFPKYVISSSLTPVLIQGNKFLVENKLQCKFGMDKYVNATLVDDKHIFCQTPSLSDGMNVTVEVSNNGNDFTQNGNMIHSISPIKLMKLVPSFGSILGGTVVRLQGSGFIADMENLYCLFSGDSEIELEATLVVLSGNEAECVSPPFPNNIEMGLVVKIVQKIPYYPLRVQINDLSVVPLSYLYTKPAHLVKIDPADGPRKGGTLITLHGTGFRQTSQLTCSFQTGSGTLLSRSTFVSENKLTCISPPVSEEKFALVRVSTNGIDYTEGYVIFSYVGDAFVESFQPTSGPVKGGVNILVHGRAFPRSSSLVCRFGLLKPVSALFINTSAVKCTTPMTTSPDILSVSVSNNGIDYSNSNLSFHYHTEPIVYSLVPNSGPIQGGTSIVVNGANLEHGSACVFGDVVVPIKERLATYSVICVAPAINIGFHASLLSKFNIVSDSSLSSDMYLDSPKLYVYQKHLVLQHIFPTIGSFEGGTVVSVKGANFVGNNMTCKFDNDNYAKAAVITSELIQCIVPKRNKPGNISNLMISVTVSNNGFDFAEDNLMFMYAESPSVLGLSAHRGQEAGGNMLRVFGKHFFKNSFTACRFNDTIIPASYVSQCGSFLECEVPPGNQVNEVQEISIEQVQNPNTGYFHKIGQKQLLSIGTVSTAGKIQKVQLKAHGQSPEVHHLRAAIDPHAAEVQVLRLSAFPQDEVQLISIDANPLISEIQLLKILAPTGSVFSHTFCIEYEGYDQNGIPIVVCGLEPMMNASDIFTQFLVRGIGLRTVDKNVFSVDNSTSLWVFKITFVTGIGNVKKMIPRYVNVVSDLGHVEVLVSEERNGTDYDVQVLTIMDPYTLSSQGQMDFSFRGKTSSSAFYVPYSNYLYDSMTADIKICLENISGIGSVSVSKAPTVVVGSGNISWHVTFTENIGQLPLLGFSVSGNPDKITTRVHRDEKSIEFPRTLSENVVGSFSLSLDPEKKPITVNCSEEELIAAISRIDTIGVVKVSRIGPDVNLLYSWRVTYLGDRGDQELLLLDASKLDGPNVVLHIHEEKKGSVLGGKIRLIKGMKYTEISVAASSQEMRDALVSLYEPDYDITVSKYGPDRGGGSQYTITHYPISNSNVELFSVDDVFLTGIEANSSVTTKQKFSGHEIQRLSVFSSFSETIYSLEVSSQASVPEIHVIEINANGENMKMEGFFSVSFGTPNAQVKLNYDDSDSIVQRKLKSISGDQQIIVSGYSVDANTYGWKVTYSEISGDLGILQITSDELIGAIASVQTIQEAVRSEIQLVETFPVIQNSRIYGGHISCSFEGTSSSHSVPFNASEVSFHHMLSSIPNIGDIRVKRSKSSKHENGAYKWYIYFDTRVGDLENLSCNSSILTNGKIMVTEFVQGEAETMDGEFYLMETISGDTSRLINVFATEAEIKSSLLEDFSVINDVTVTKDAKAGYGIHRWHITFKDPTDFDSNFNLVSVVSSLTGTKPYARLDLIEEGRSGDIVPKIYGSFFIVESYGHTGTVSLLANATADEVKFAVESINGLNSGPVRVSRSSIAGGYNWDITFISKGGDIPLLKLDDTDLISPNGKIVATFTKVYDAAPDGCCVDGFFRLRFGDFSEALGGNVSLEPDNEYAMTEFDLRGNISRGDALKIGNGIYYVHLLNEFSASKLPLDRPFTGLRFHGITFVRKWSNPLAYNASADDVQAELESLCNGVNNKVKNVDVISDTSAEANGGKVWRINYDNILVGLPFPFVDNTGMNKGSVKVFQESKAAVADVQKIYLPISNLLRGTFRLGFNSAWTDDIAFNASENEMKVALESLDTIGLVNISRVKNDSVGFAAITWFVTFVDNAGNLELLEANSESLQGFASHTTHVMIEKVTEGTSNNFSTGGSFKLGFVHPLVSSNTITVDFNASSSSFRSALIHLGVGKDVDVSRSRPDHNGGYTWTITFPSNYTFGPLYGYVETRQSFEDLQENLKNFPTVPELQMDILNPDQNFEGFFQLSFANDIFTQSCF